MALLALAACSGGQAASGLSKEPATPPPPAGADWTTYHFDAVRSGAPPGVPVPGRLRKVWSAALDGAVYGQPLVIGQTVVAATEGNSVYALDRATGKVLWHTFLGRPVRQSDLPCGDIDPLGITGTPVYDRGSGRVYVVAETGGFHHVLVGISIKNGAIQVTRDILAPDGNPRNDLQRGALTLANGRVYVAFGGLYGDCGQYVGSVVGVPLSGQGETVTWKVPTTREGGIWATGGPTIGPDGTIFVASGNGQATAPPFDGSDSITALTADLKMKSQFAPDTWADDNANDLDLGSMSPAVVVNRVLAVGKRGIAYLLQNPNLGGINGQVTKRSLCSAYGAPSVSGDTIYVPCGDGGTAAIGIVGDQIRVLWRGPSDADGSPVVGGATVWTTGAGALIALDQGTGKVRGRIDIGRLPHFASPTLSGGLVLLGTMHGVVAVSGS